MRKAHPMIVLSREAGTSLVIGEHLWTVIKVLPDRHEVAVRLGRVGADPAEASPRQAIRLAIDTPVRLGVDTEIVLIDLRADVARFAVTAPPDVAIHRLEVHEAIMRQQPRADDADDGLAGSRVPRPPTPRPPALRVRLNEPPPAAGA